MIRRDIIQELNGFSIQFGKLSDRVYLLDYLEKYDGLLLENINVLARYHNYSKIIIKAGKDAATKLEKDGFICEGQIHGYHRGQHDALFMVKYLNPKRLEHDKTAIKEVLEKSDRLREDKLDILDRSYRIRLLTLQDVPEMAALFKKVFATYPFPIFEEEYLRETMEDNCIYLGVFSQEKLIGISNCETSPEHLACEMTDFAIDEQHRGHKLARHLLEAMEQRLREMDFKTVYTIARSASLPMNATFKKAGYKYGGTLINNTQISGSIESMNIYYKALAGQSNQT
ncbi:MAG: putative beta-lysine N-acetyltransferase [Erysipelotrichaceae bacterium]|nr:putative beta-lysine N-acetyltransferase [Erysipelotrichaceae bacterium]